MTLQKPQHIADNPIMSQKWDEITEGRNFSPIHATTIEQLCFWYAVLRTCQEDITIDGNIQVAYANEYGDIKAMPQMASAKQASDQIRQLNKQLGINDEAPREQPKKRNTTLNVIQTNRFARAKNSRTA